MRITYELSRFFGTANEFDKTAVLLEICNRDPSLLLDCVHTATTPSWQKEAEDLLRAQKKINAIKLWRAKTGMTLKDAKDAVEALQRKLGL